MESLLDGAFRPIHPAPPLIDAQGLVATLHLITDLGESPVNRLDVLQVGLTGTEQEPSPSASLEVPQRVQSFHPSLTVPRFTGYDDIRSVADFVRYLAVYKTASSASDEFLLARVLPVALETSTWR